MKYIPDDFLTPEQMEGKKEGIRRDIDKYPNSPFRRTSPGADERKVQQLAIIQESNPMWDNYHTGIRSAEDIRTWEEVLKLDDEREGQFVWGDFSREDAKNALKNNSVTIYSSHPISNGTFVSTSYIQAWE